MPDYTNFDRQYRLAIGKAGQQGFEVGHTNAECPIPLHISFSLQKSDLETPNTGKVSVWNLNDKHLSVLNQKDCVVALKAGYGERISLIFGGIVSVASTSQDGANRKTEIEVVDSLVEIRDTYVSLSYNGSINWKNIFESVANQMGVAIEFSYNAKFVDVPNGYTYVGLAKNVLNKGCDCCNLSWSIQNGVLQMKRPGDVMSTKTYLLSPQTGMIGIPKRVVVSKDNTTGTQVLGWDVEYLLNGAINVNDYVKLKSGAVSGDFRVYSVEAQGDNRSGDWLCKARLLEVD